MNKIILYNNTQIIKDVSKTYLNLDLDFVSFPKKTSSEILSFPPTQGFVVFNTDTSELWIANGIEWSSLVKYNSYEKETTITFQTINNNFVNVFSEPINTDEVLRLQIKLTGRVINSNNIWISDILVGAVKHAGVITITGANFRNSENIPVNPVISFTNNNNMFLNFNVHSGNTKTINWIAKILVSKTTLS